MLYYFMHLLQSEAAIYILKNTGKFTKCSGRKEDVYKSLWLLEATILV